MGDSKQTFTPGPWAVFLNTGRIVPESHLGRILGGSTNHDRDRDLFVQTIAIAPKDAYERGDHTANATLIAAAPSLYEFVSRKALEGDEDAARLIANI